jgi:multisubunit Na+/H+ antiporter MnhB subunit
MIREVILGGGIIYLIIILLQAIARPSVGMEAIVAGSILAVATAFYWYRNHEGLHRWEAVALWGAVFLFLLYGVLKYTGVV